MIAGPAANMKESLFFSLLTLEFRCCVIHAPDRAGHLFGKEETGTGRLYGSRYLVWLSVARLKFTELSRDQSVQDYFTHVP